MDKNLSVNLGGVNLIITEEGYNRLNQYLEAIRIHYQSAEAKEILADIEASLASKLKDRLEKNGGVVTLVLVEEVIGIMGTVEEITQSDETSGNPVNDRDSAEIKKKLYRSTDDVIIAGVASGLAAYFGIDAVFVRILFIVATLINGLGIVIYLVLWLVVPKAVTNAQKLEMAGRPVNLNELQNVIKEKSKTIGTEGREAINRLSNSSAWRRILNFPILVLERIFSWLKIILSKIGPLFLIIGGAVILLVSFFLVLGLTVVLGLALFNIGSPYIISDIPLHDLAIQPFYYIGLVSLYLSVIIPTVLLIVLSLTMLKKKNLFSLLLIGVLAFVWIVAITSTAVAITRLAPEIKYKTEQAWSANTETRSFDYKDFTKVYLTGNLNVTVKPGKEFSINLTGDKEDLDRLEFNTENGQLQVLVRSKERGQGICLLCFDRQVRGEITMPKLDSVVTINNARVSLSGFKDDLYVSVGENGQVEAELNGQNLSGNVNGIVGQLKLDGQANKIDLALTGYGHLQMKELEADTIDLNLDTFSRAKLVGRVNKLFVSSQGHSLFSGLSFAAQQASVTTADYSEAEVWAVGSLEAVAKNHSVIYYKGEPKLSQKVLDYGQIEKWFDDELQPIEDVGKVYIQTDVKKYAPWMSSVRGVRLMPVYTGINNDEVLYKWSITQGTLVTDWSHVSKKLTATTSDENEPVYWTYMFDDKSLDKTEPVYIRLEAVSPNNSLIGTSSIKFQINENGEAVYIGEE